MAKPPKKKLGKPEIKDEPGAEARFSRILKKALSTPPGRKALAVKRGKPKKG
jgi:hypothetical protein